MERRLINIKSISCSFYYTPIRVVILLWKYCAGMRRKIVTNTIGFIFCTVYKRHFLNETRDELLFLSRYARVVFILFTRLRPEGLLLDAYTYLVIICKKNLVSMVIWGGIFLNSLTVIRLIEKNLHKNFNRNLESNPARLWSIFVMHLFISQKIFFTRLLFYSCILFVATRNVYIFYRYYRLMVMA